MFIKNKHVVISLLVAPVLALLSYFMVGVLVGEKPQAAQPGSAYPLIAKSACRYPSGFCTFNNKDMSLTLKVASESQGVYKLTLESNHSLDGVTVSIVSTSSDVQSSNTRSRKNTPSSNTTSIFYTDEHTIDLGRTPINITEKKNAVSNSPNSVTTQNQSVTSENKTLAPTQMMPENASRRKWSITFNRILPNQTIRLVASAKGAFFYGETENTFIFL